MQYYKKHLATTLPTIINGTQFLGCKTIPYEEGEKPYKDFRYFPLDDYQQFLNEIKNNQKNLFQKEINADTNYYEYYTKNQKVNMFFDIDLKRGSTFFSQIQAIIPEIKKKVSDYFLDVGLTSRFAILESHQMENVKKKKFIYLFILLGCNR